jgi:hypothetical protein
MTINNINSKPWVMFVHNHLIKKLQNFCFEDKHELFHS